MKILFLIDSLGTGGAEKSMVELAKFLNINGHEITFLCLYERDVSHAEDVKNNGINILYIKKDNIFFQIRYLNFYLKKERPDIIHSVLFKSDILLRISKLFFKKIITIQSLVSTPYSIERTKDVNVPKFKLFLVKQIDTWTSRLSPSYYHAITSTVFNHYKDLFKIKNNYRIIYRGRNENNFDSNKNKNEFVLVNVGRQEFAKGQIDILKALKHLNENLKFSENKIKIKLKIIGFKGRSSNDLIKFIEENNLQEQVELIGFVNNVEQRIVNADVFIFPSYYEGLGGSLIEAFAAKLPCICSEIPVLKEVVGNKNGALFCEPGNYQQIAENIYKLYNDIDLRHNLSEYSYFRFKSAFEMDTINDQMLAMYTDLYMNEV